MNICQIGIALDINVNGEIADLADKGRQQNGTKQINTVKQIFKHDTEEY